MSTVKTVKSLFDEYCSHLQVDAKFAYQLQSYRQNFANKNEDHVAFFGGHLMGVQEVKFLPSDKAEWFNHLLDIDEVSLQDELLTLKTLVPDPKKVRFVSTDVMNLSCLWLVHALYNSNIPQQQKHNAMVDCLLTLEYKFITSILAYWFPHRADEAVAVATYARLTKKFKLKEVGSWGALLLYLAEHMLSDKSPHFKNKTFQQFTDDYNIIYMVNDIQGRIKDYLKNIRDEFEIVRRDPTALIRTNSNTVTIDGEVLVKNKRNVYSTYRRYLNDVMADKNSFIIKELSEIVVGSMPKLPYANMITTLEYMVANSGLKGDKNVAKLTDLVLEHLFEFISSSRDTVNSRDIPTLLSKLRNLYTASRAANPLLLDIRDIGEKVVLKAVKTKNSALVSSIRTGVLLYLVLRTVTMSHYRKN
jgi:hypothetical protein